MTNIINDAFVETGGNVDLTAHTTDEGDSWVKRIDTSIREARVIDADDNTGSNGNENNAGLLYTVNVAVDAEQDATITIDAIAADNADAAGIVARYVDTTHYLLMSYLGSGATNDVKIIQVTPTTADVLGVDTTAVIATDTFKLELRGTVPKVYKNGSGTPLITGTACVDVAGEVGLHWGNTSGTAAHDVDSAWRFDDLVVDHFPAAGANPKGPLGMPLHGPFGGPIG